MDLRSIINSEASNAAQPGSVASQASPVGRGYPPNHRPSASSYPETRQDRPAGPPPLQTAVPDGFRSPGPSSSYPPTQSPYQRTPSSSQNTGQYPFPQLPIKSPSQGHHPPAYPQRDGYPSATPSGQPLTYHPAHGQVSPSQYGPAVTTPGNAPPYSQPHPPQSSHSTPTPTPVSAQSSTPYPYSGSPMSASSQSYAQSQQYQRPQSQPGTPLGPPATFNNRPIGGNSRDPQSPYEYPQNQAGVAHALPPQAIATSAQPPIQGQGRPTISPHHYSLSQPALSETEKNVRDYLTDRDRERSLSVSPKTRVPSQVRHESIESKASGSANWNGRVPAKRKQSDGPRYEEQRPMADQPIISGAPDRREGEWTGQQPLKPSSQSEPTAPGSSSLDGRYVNENGVNNSFPPPPAHLEQVRTNTLSPPASSASRPPPFSRDHSRPDSRGRATPASSESAGTRPLTPRTGHRGNSATQPTPERSISQPRGSSLGPPPIPASALEQQSAAGRDHESSFSSANSPHQPMRKRPRYDEPPIFARKASRSTSSSPLMSNRRQPGASSAAAAGVPAIKQEPRDARLPPPPSSSPPAIKSEANGHPPAQPAPPVAPVQPTSSVALPQPQPVLADVGPLGPWEPSITNVLPYEEITRVISDFLFTQVVLREDVGTGQAGNVPGQGAQLEIEAKIGQLIDKNTNHRLSLPVMTECVISHDDPHLRVNFQSSMTEAQHRTLNEFLNKALINSQPPKATPGSSEPPPPRTRMPMRYVHTHERDSFYELQPHAYSTLPPSIRAQLNPRHKVKVRVTTDQKTNKVLAKIVKARVADLDVYSPRTAFDWRVSVNLEMNYEGEIEDLVEGHEGGRRTADRNKDRMSYKHLAYQVDLTQVTPNDPANKMDKEHELEIEVSSAEVRRQGNRARNNEVSQYEDLVRGFVDNVRVLARAINPMDGR
ncbi:MAG: hypothetical protein M1819_003400 [Sarea resinae]|nr:MAG: hypothetical protein M1819_003400 [Sarea resinae]